jgi:hypothetical protein
MWLFVPKFVIPFFPMFLLLLKTYCFENNILRNYHSIYLASYVEIEYHVFTLLLCLVF